MQFEECSIKPTISVPILVHVADIVRAAEGLSAAVQRPLALHHGRPLRDRPPRQDHRLDPQAQEGAAIRLGKVHVPGE